MTSPLPLILALSIPVILAPLITYGSRRLYVVFLREGAELFVGLVPHGELARDTAKTISIINTAIFTLAWWAAVGLRVSGLSMFAVVVPFFAALALGMYLTRVEVKLRLRLSPGDAWLVGLLTFAGGNLPIILAMPLLLMLVPQA